MHSSLLVWFLRAPTRSAGLLVLTLTACGTGPSDSGANANGANRYAAGSPRANPSTAASDAPAPAAGETYADNVKENDFLATATTAVSTFAIDVDTASYSLMRRDLTANALPDARGVRVEEYVNYFGYEYPQPTDDKPFAVSLEGAPAPFGENLTLLRVGLQGKNVTEVERKPANLVFLIDVSGSMQSADKLPLVQFGLKQLVKRLAPTDSLGIVVYAGSDKVLLTPTPVSNKSAILDAIDSLTAGGATAGEAGIRAAYEQAEKARKENGINRVVLCTDGDFNVGLTGDPLIKLIETYRDKGITLTTLGFGSGNYNDRDMEQLADKGNGNYAYIDGPGQAVRVLGEKLVGTLQVIAKDVKVQVEFDPAVVRRYRLIGYENRLLREQDFRDDQKDAGEIGAGHSVTAFYEAELTDQAANLGTVRLRYKAPDGDVAQEFAAPWARESVRSAFPAASPGFRFGAAVAEFAEILRKSQHSTGARFDDVHRFAEAGSPTSETDKTEFLGLVTKAKELWR